MDPESNSSNQEFQVKLNSDLDLDDLLKVKEAYPNNPLIGHININSIRNKFLTLCEILKKAPIDILCIIETKSDRSFHDGQFKVDRYQFPPFRKDRNAKDGCKIVFIRHVLVVKGLKFLKPKLLKQFA